MAKATKLIKEVTKTIVEEKEIGVTLELTKEEALTLTYICGRITGCSNKSARKYADSIFLSLRKIVKDDIIYNESLMCNGSTGIYFSDNSAKLIQDNCK